MSVKYFVPKKLNELLLKSLHSVIVGTMGRIINEFVLNDLSINPTSIQKGSYNHCVQKNVLEAGSTQFVGKS